MAKDLAIGKSEPSDPRMAAAHDISQERIHIRPMLVLVLVLGYFAVMAGLFAALTPPFESPDETGHTFYINFVATHVALPDQYDPARSVVGEGHQFPLFYILAAVPVRLFIGDNSVDLLPEKNQRHLFPGAEGRQIPKFRHHNTRIFADDSDELAFYGLRAGSVALGLLTLASCYLVAGELTTSQPLRLLAVFGVASLPQFLFISASINNDNLAVTTSTASVAVLLRSLRSPTPRNLLLLGVTLGLALMTKKTALFLVPAVVVSFGCLLGMTREARRGVLMRMLITPSVALAFGGWTFARNQYLYGDPLGNEMERRTLSELVDEKSLWSSYWLDPFLTRTYESFIGVFGWMNVDLPEIVYRGYLLLFG